MKEIRDLKSEILSRRSHHKGREMDLGGLMEACAASVRKAEEARQYKESFHHTKAPNENTRNTTEEDETGREMITKVKNPRY